MLLRFIFGYTSAVNEVGPLLSFEDLDTFKSKDSYNEDAKELCDRVADGIQAGRNLSEVLKEFNRWLSEFEVEEPMGYGWEEPKRGGRVQLRRDNAEMECT